MNNGVSGVHTFPTEVTDVLNEYNPATSTFTATRSGNYFISVSTRFTTTVGISGWNIIGIRVNGTTIVEANSLGTTAYRNYGLDRILPLAAGDQVTILWNNNSGSNLTADNNTSSQQLIIAQVA